MAKTAGTNCTIIYPHFTDGFFRFFYGSAAPTLFRKQWKVVVNRLSGAQSLPPTHRRKHFCTNTDSTTETHTCHLPPLRAALLTCTRGTFLATLSTVSSVCSVFYSFGGNFPLFLLVQTQTEGGLVRKSTPNSAARLYCAANSDRNRISTDRESC